MSTQLVITPRALALRSCIHEAELARARRSPFLRLLLMRGYAGLLERAGLPVEAWWRSS